ncbi:hypothetical protein [Alsobacter sp. SYSU BS001988]
MKTTGTSPTQDDDALLRAELLAAFAREGIAYPPDRLEEAVAEYLQLKRLLAVVATAGVPPEPQADTSR